MGIQNIILLVLCLIIVGIALAIAISKFSAQADQANKDGMTTSLLNIAENAYQFKMRPISMGGGGGAYDQSMGARSAYVVPDKMTQDDYGTYGITFVQAHTCLIQGISSRQSEWSMECTVNDSGKTIFQCKGW